MKAGRIILIVIGLVVVLGAIGFFVQKDFDVTRSVTIDADRETVHAVLTDFNQFAEWNPWGDIDPNMTYSVEGEPGTVGHSYTWESENDSVGNGVMTMDYISDETISIKVSFSGGQYELSSGHNITTTDAGTEVTWFASGSMPYIFAMMADMDATIGAQYEQGLSRLQGMVETMEPMAEEVEVSTVTLEPMTFVGYRAEVAIDDMQSAYDEAKIGSMYEAIMMVTQEVGPMATLYYVWDEENNRTEMAVAVQVPAGTEVPGFETFETTEMMAAKATHTGTYDNIGETHEAMMGYVAENGYGWDETNPSMEVYTVGMGDTENEDDLVTEIYHAIKAPAEAAE